MDASWVRDLCLSFPSGTEHVIWGNDLTFKVAGKMFAHAVLGTRSRVAVLQNFAGQFL